VSDEFETLEDRCLSEWGMSAEELDREHIQKPVGQFAVKVTRWKTLPTAAFRRITERYAESTGEFEQLEHKCFVHGAPVKLATIVSSLWGPGEIWCAHEVGGAYVVDPHAVDRVRQFLDLWRKPVPA
jgi:hypothetical protein